MEWQFGSLPEADEAWLGAGGSDEAGPELLVEFGGVGGGRIGEVAPFDAVPDVLDRIQHGRVAGQGHGLEAGRIEKSCGGGVDFPAVPNDDEATAEVPQQVPQECDDMRGLKVAVFAGAEVEAEAIATRSQRQRGHHRHFLSVTTADGEDRRLAARGERAADEGVQQEAALVDENNGGPLAARPF